MTRHIPPILSISRRILLDLIIPLLAFAGMMEILRWLGVPWGDFLGVRCG